MALRKQHFGDDADKFIVFWNNRNAGRKRPVSLILYFQEFLKRVGQDKAVLLMHTSPADPAGQPLNHILERFEMNRGQVKISDGDLIPTDMNKLYNMVDCTVSISNAEGWGLSISESLLAGVPVVCTKTGGMQEQLTDGINIFGELIEPTAQCVIGSQGDVPYIYEDVVGEKDFVDALERIYNKTPEERQRLGQLGQQHALKNYTLKDYINKWDRVFQDTVEEFGSWPNKQYQRFTIKTF